MKYTSPIDPHVHLRWTEYGSYSFLPWAIDDANAVGLAAVMEMGNTTPQITDEDTIQRRIEYVDDVLASVPAYHKRAAEHFIHPGLTDSIIHSVHIFRLLRNEEYEQVRAVKLYTCHSTGRMGLTDRRHRRNVWQIAAEVGWTGPVVVHAENHELFGPEPFNPATPSSHSRYQNENSEVSGAIETLVDAFQAEFAGTIVLAHTSSPDTVVATREWLTQWKPKFTVAFEVTWHHLFLNVEDDYFIHGNRVKMNPPLRLKASQERLLNLFLSAPKDFFVGTDHAPHPVDAKDRLDPAPASGVPALPFWPKGIALLRAQGMSEDNLRWVTFDHANQVFHLSLEPFEVEVNYDPSRWDKYGWNPFSRLG